MRKLYISSIVLTTFLLIISACSSHKRINKSVVPSISLPRYLGTWYEIARFNHVFERGLVRVSATYSLREDGKIRVINKGYKGSINGKVKSVEGYAIIPDPKVNSRLKVYFFPLIGGAYYILDLDQENYQWALVGSSSDSYLWILSRTPKMDSDLYEHILDIARSRGYDTSKLIKVEQ